ncbi:MAG: enoyl-CoA hydratase/isomerase family protein, partial [Kofleriaceae bacterium]
MSSSQASIKLERRGEVAWITFDDPDRRNPLTPEFITRMLAIFDELEADAECRVVVLTGTGKAFCAGAELSTIVNTDGMDAEVQFRLVRGFNRVIARIRELDLPVIAALNGVAVGGGAALALACDFAIASERASLMFAFGRIGAASADMGLTWLLPRMVGIARARQLLLTGETLDAKA